MQKRYKVRFFIYMAAVSWFCGILAGNPVVSQERFNGHSAFAYVEQLCREEYQGRRSGTIEARRAAEWIAGQFSAWGLQPAGDNGSFLQHYPMLVTRQTEKAQMRLLNGAFGQVQYIEGVDFTVYLNSGSGEYTAETVFAGYGICEPDRGRDDYHGIDVAGKIVFIYRGLPKDKQDWEFANERDYKMRIAASKGAVALLILERGDRPTRGGTIHEEGYYPHLIAYNISKKVAYDLFAGTAKDLDSVIRELERKPISFALNKRLHLAAKIRQIKSGMGENVVALLEGSDSELASQYIIVGGHMDHTGADHFGHIYHGADDNASGTAVVMELARTLSQRKERPKRSIIFVAFGGEEQGLRGSRYFAYHPPVPRENIVAMINFDMVGAGDGGAGISGVNYFPLLMPKMQAGWSDSIAKKTRLGRGWGMGGSDHAHFVEQGIPAIGFYSTGGHPFYHQYSDVPPSLNVASLQFVGDRAMDLLVTLANADAEQLPAHAREGYFFLHHGNQIDWDMTRHRVNTFAQIIDNQIVTLTDAAIRMIVVGLALPTTSSMDSLYLQMDAIDQTVKHSDQLLRYEGSASIDQAAANNRIAVAIGLQGSQLFHRTPHHFRNLAKLGLDIVQMADRQDPVFDDDRVSENGKRFLQTCRDYGIILDWALADTLSLNGIVENYDGKLCWHLSLHQATAVADYVKRHFKDASKLLVIDCRGDESIDAAAHLLDQFGANNLHLNFLPDDASSLFSPAQWLQSFYRLRRKAVGDQKAFKEMEQVLSGNLKKMLTDGS